MASDPGRDSSDDLFAASANITHSPAHCADIAEHAHTAEAQSETFSNPGQAAEGLHRGSSIEVTGAELYDKEMKQQPDWQA